MGQSISFDKKHKFQYKVKNISKEFSIQYDPDVQLPPEMNTTREQIFQKFTEYLDSVETEIPNRNQLNDLPIKTMKQLVFIHEKVLIKYQIPPLTPTLDGLSNVLQHMTKMSLQDLQTAIDGMKIIETLTTFLEQECSNDSDKQCFCLNILSLILKVFPNHEFPTNTLYQIGTAMNPIHTINASLALEIFTQVCWQSDLGVENVLQALDDLKLKQNWKYTMEPFFKLLEVQTNIFVVVNACTFLNTLVESHSSPVVRNSLKDKLQTYGIGVIYGDIKQRLTDGDYKAKNCSFSKMIKELQEQKDKPPSSAVLKYYCKTLEYADLETPVDIQLFTKSCTFLFIEEYDKQADEKIQIQVMMLKSQIEAFEELMDKYEDTGEEQIPENTQLQESQIDHNQESVILESGDKRLIFQRLATIQESIYDTNDNNDDSNNNKMLNSSNTINNNNQGIKDLFDNYNDKPKQRLSEINQDFDKPKQRLSESVQDYDRPKQRLSEISMASSIRGSYIPQAQSMMIQSIRPSHQANSTNQSMKVSMMKNSMVQQILVPDNLIIQINQILSKIRAAKSLDEVVNHLTVFSEDSSSVGVSVVTRLLDVLANKLEDFSSITKKDRFKKTRSREILETSNAALQEQIITLQLEVKQLYKYKEMNVLKINIDKYTRENIIQLEGDQEKLRTQEKKNNLLIEQLKQDIDQRKLQIKDHQKVENDLKQQLSEKTAENVLIKLEIKELNKKVEEINHDLTQAVALMKKGLLAKKQDRQELAQQQQLSQNNQSSIQQSNLEESNSNTSDQNLPSRSTLLKFVGTARRENKEAKQQITQQEEKIKQMDISLNSGKDQIKNLQDQIIHLHEQVNNKVPNTQEHQGNQLDQHGTNLNQVNPIPTVIPLPLTQIANVAPPAPPPMFGVQKKNEPTKTKCIPSRQMKQLPWQLVKFDSVKGTIWEGMNETEIIIDRESIEEMFGAKPQFQKQLSTVPKKQEVQKVSLLPVERQKNIELILGRVRISYSKIRESILSCDTDTLKQNVIESLVNACPQDSEIALYARPEDLDVTTLATPDLFFLEMSSIPRYSDRLNSLQSQYTCQEYYDDLRKRVQQFETTLHKIQEDQGFKILFKYTLAYGNYLNGQGNKGGAFGFKLDSLIKTADIKSNNNQQNLFMTIVMEAEKDLKKDLYDASLHQLMNIELMVKMPISQLSSDLQELKKTHKYVDKAISSQSDHPTDRAEEHFTPLSSKLTNFIGSLESSISQLENTYEKLCNFYAENPKSLPSDKFFEIVQNVWSTYKQGKQQVEHQRIKAAKDEERQRLQIALDQRKRLSTKNSDDSQEVRNRSSLNTSTLVGLQKSNKDEVLNELQMKQSQRFMNKMKTIS